MRRYVPLSQRSRQDIRVQGKTYLHMAATARTAVTKVGLAALAVRFAATADRREVAQRNTQLSPHRASQDMELSNATN
jgi:hypothetical protein